MSVLYDAHCHFDFPVFDGRRGAVLSRCAEAGVDRLVIAGVRRSDWPRVRETAEAWPGLYYCLGIHPWWAEDHGDDDLSALEQMLIAGGDRCVALGECGLDAVHGDPAVQAPLFRAQVKMAARLDLPLVIHSVRTHDRVAAILRETRYRGMALVHGFSGSYQQASRLLDEGCLLGIGGLVTRGRARKLRDVVARVPLSALVLETDSPDMPPEGVAPGENSPENVVRVFSAICGLRREAPARVRDALWDNACRLYRW